MFDEDEDGGKWITGNNYYGELTFTVSYKNETEDTFPWLFLDYNTLQNAAFANGLQCELILEGEHYDYLARLFVWFVGVISDVVAIISCKALYKTSKSSWEL